MIAKNPRRNEILLSCIEWKFRRKKGRKRKERNIHKGKVDGRPLSTNLLKCPRSFRLPSWRFRPQKVSADFHARPSSVTTLHSKLERSIKLRLFKREKFPGNLFKSAAINYRHVRGLSLFILARTFSLPPFLPLLYSRSWLEAVDFGYQVVVEMAFAITVSALVSRERFLGLLIAVRFSSWNRCLLGIIEDHVRLLRLQRWSMDGREAM